MLDAALAYARLGWAVFPLIPGGKRPAPGITSWPDAATTKSSTVTQWWTNNPNYNIGIACGPSNLLIVDCDEKGIGGGLANWYELGSQHGDFITTYTVLTASRPFPGEHWYFSCPPGLRLKNSVNEIAASVDVKTDGGYIVAPPSIVGDGAYSVDNPGPLAPAPSWLLELVKRPAKKRSKVTTAEPTERSLRRGLGVLSKAQQAVEATPEGSRNATLFKKAKACAGLITGGLLTEEMIWDYLRPAGLSAGLDGEEVDTTIRQGLRYGITEPWDPDGD